MSPTLAASGISLLLVDPDLETADLAVALGVNRDPAALDVQWTGRLQLDHLSFELDDRRIDCDAAGVHRYLERSFDRTDLDFQRVQRDLLVGAGADGDGLERVVELHLVAERLSQTGLQDALRRHLQR